MAIFVTQHVRRMRGGSQAHLMRASDGNFYVVKFKNNPQHSRVLVNELLATRMAERIGLQTPVAEVVEVGEWLVRQTPELHIQLAGKKVPCEPGLQFGSRFVVNPMDGQVLDYMPEAMLDPAAGHLRNPEVCLGALAFDKWVCNADGRQMVYWRRGRERKYTATLVDQGHCFNAGEWTFPDSPLRGVFAMNMVYAGARSWQSFEPWLTRIQDFDPAAIAALAESVPPEWYGGAWDALHALVEKMVARRARVRELIDDFRNSSRHPFPAWQAGRLGAAAVD